MQSSEALLKQVHKSIVVVIPTYNERQNIDTLITDVENKLSTFSSSFEMLIIDDNSPDGTASKCEELNKNYNNITVLRREKKTGLGSAYKAGIRYAIDTFNPQIIITMDADGSHSPEYLRNFVEAIIAEKKDVAIGSRKVKGGEVLGWDTYRHTVSSLANSIARLTCGFRVHDVTSGYRAYRTEKLARVIDCVRSSNFEFQIEILFYLHQTESRIVELPIVFKNRRFGESKLTRKQIIQFLCLCLKFLFQRIR